MTPLGIDGSFDAIVDDVPGVPDDSWRQREALDDAAALDRRPLAMVKPAGRRRSRFNRIDFLEIMTRKAKSPDFILDDWMVAREVSFFAGESEAGKTFLAIDVAMRVALGWPVFGRKTKPGLVIYQIGESGESLTNLRLPAWLHQFGKDIPVEADGKQRVPFVVLQSKINLWTDDPHAKDGTRELLAEIADVQADYPDYELSLFVVDTFNKAFRGGNEIDGKDVGRVIGNAELIAKTTGGHVAIIHHLPKGGLTLRGHGSLRGDVDSVAMIKTDPQTKIRTVSLDKLKDGEKSSMQFELMQVRLGEREDGKPITSCVVLPVGEKQKAREDVSNAVRLSTTEFAMFQAMWKAIADFGIVPPTALECGATAKVVPYDEVKRIYIDRSPDDAVEKGNDDQAREDDRRRHLDRLRKQMKSAAEKMVSTWKVMAIGKCLDPDTGKETYYAWWTGRPVKGMPPTYPSRPKREELPPALTEGGDWLSDIVL